MKGQDKSARELLVAAIDIFLQNEDLNQIVITRSRNAVGDESANVFKEDGSRMKLILFQTFRKKGQAFDPELRKKLLG